MTTLRLTYCSGSVCAAGAGLIGTLLICIEGVLKLNVPDCHTHTGCPVMITLQYSHCPGPLCSAAFGQLSVVVGLLHVGCRYVCCQDSNSLGATAAADALPGICLQTCGSDHRLQPDCRLTTNTVGMCCMQA